MTAWSILLSNTTVPAASTAWLHLNNQTGGGVSSIFYEETSVVLDSTINVLLEPSLPELYVFVDSDIEVLIEDADNFATTTELLVETNG